MKYQIREILLLFSGYVFGVLFFDTFFSKTDLLATLCIGAAISFALLFVSYLHNHFLRPLFAPISLLFWFFAGGIQFYNQQGNLSQTHFENSYTIHDEVILKTIDVAPSATGKTTKVIGEVQAIIRDKDTIATHGKLLAYFEKSQKKIKLDQLILFTPTLSKIENRNNPGEFDAVRYWSYQGIHYQTFVPDYNYVTLLNDSRTISSYFLEIRNHLSSIIDRYLTGQEAAVAKGLILGDRSAIEAETTRMFGNTGVTHILAVSGMHVAILVLILNYILQLFPKYITKKQAVLISLLLVWFYSLMTGFSASVARAAWMFTFISAGTLLSRRYYPINGLLFSALVILIISPFSLYDIGFQLSYAAMIGIYTFYPYLKNQLYFKNKWIRTIWEGTALSIAAQLITTPLAIYYFHQFPNYFLLTNIALSAYSLVVLSLGLGLLVFNWWTLFGKIIGFVLFWVMFSMLWIIQLIDSLPQSVSEGFVLSGWIVLVLYGLMGALYWSLVKKKITYLIPTLVIAIGITGVIVLNRFRRMNETHLIVFNHSNLVLALKNKEQLFVFYDEKKVPQKQLHQLIEPYRKVFPTSSCDTIALTNQKEIKLSLKHIQLVLNSVKGGIALDVNKEHYFVATNSRFDSNNRSVILLSTIEDRAYYHHLKTGSLILNLSPSSGMK